MDVPIFVQPKLLAMLVIKERKVEIAAAHVAMNVEDAVDEL
jgi:hypothetical protein